MKKVLKHFHACKDARDWCADRSIESAWKECERGDWMLWLAAKLLERKIVVRAACACARTSLKFVKPGEDRQRIAIETAEKWCDGNASIEEVKCADAAADAADAAADAADDAADAAADDAADDAGDAAA